MSWWWLLLSGVGLVAAGWSIALARRPTIGPGEVSAFHAVNGAPNWLFPVLWPPMQLGNLVVGLLAGLTVAVVTRHAVVAVGVVLAAGLKLVVERVVRREMAGHLAVRQRPGTSQIGAVLRGRDVPTSGPSFPSGHVILVTSVALTVTPELPVGWWWIPIGLALVVMFARVYVGAHNPLDVVAGFGAGLVLGGALAAFVAGRA